MILSAIKSIFAENGSSEIPAMDEQKIRELAYLLWEEAGRPEGDGAEFWLKAESQLSGI
jgi:hypothetical protein